MIHAAPALLALAGKQVLRHRVRSLLTVLGVASGMFLFTAVETVQRSLDRATRTGADDTTLVVYRENRFCPFTSRLPEWYRDQILDVPGVREAIPVKVTVNNCGASLDVITFRGVPPGELLRYAPDIELVEGSIERWKKGGDGALVGQTLARNRGLSPGDKFDAAGVTVSVAGIVRSPNPQDNTVAYVDLPFLQQASSTGLGIVTQFNVRTDPGSDLEAVAGAIDERFRSEAEPTSTRPENAFFADVTRELIGLVRFTRWVGLGAVLAVVSLVANALLLAVRARVVEQAVLQTLGYPGAALAFLVLAEGCLLGLAGGVLGVGASAGFLAAESFTLGNEGQTLGLRPDAAVVATGIAASLALGLLAGLWPAWRSSRQPIVESLRT